MRRSPFLTLAVVILLVAGTAVAVAQSSTEPPPRIAVVARGDGANFADALAVGSVAGQLGAPVFTTTPSSLPQATADGLVEYDPDLVIVTGGQVAVSDDVIEAIVAVTGLSADDVVRAAGKDRYETAAAIASIFVDLGLDPAYLLASGKAADADALDGLDSTDFQPAGDYVVDGELDADTLGGMGPDAWATHQEMTLRDLNEVLVSRDELRRGGTVESSEQLLSATPVLLGTEAETCREGLRRAYRTRIDVWGEIQHIGSSFFVDVYRGEERLAREGFFNDGFDWERVALSFPDVGSGDDAPEYRVIVTPNPEPVRVDTLSLAVSVESVVCSGL